MQSIQVCKAHHHLYDQNISLSLQRACSSLVFFSYSYQVNQYSLANISNSSEKNLSIYICSVLNLFKSSAKLFHTNSIISIRPRNLHTNLYSAANLSFEIIHFFQSNSLIELTAKHTTWCFWLNSDKINSIRCKICQICQGNDASKKLLKPCLNKQETVQ